MPVNRYLDYEGLEELVLKVKEYVGNSGKLEFKGTVATVNALPNVSGQNVGYMYTIQAAGTTTADFTDGEGDSFPANSEVAAVNVAASGEPPVMKWCLLGSVFDVSDKLTFGVGMPQNPAEGDVFFYIGPTVPEYNPVTPEGSENPSREGWYESDGLEPPTYTRTDDTEVEPGKTYYTLTEFPVKGTTYKYVGNAWVVVAGEIVSIGIQEIDALFN